MSQDFSTTREELERRAEALRKEIAAIERKRDGVTNAIIARRQTLARLEDRITHLTDPMLTKASA